MARSGSSRRPPIRCGSSPTRRRSEEHTSELQSLTNLVCRLLLEKKKKKQKHHNRSIQIKAFLQRTNTNKTHNHDACMHKYRTYIMLIININLAEYARPTIEHA